MTLVVDTRINDPINVPKLIVLILVSAWLTTDLINSYMANPVKRNSVQFIFVTIVLLFLIAQLIAIFTGNVIFTQVFGETQRKNGLVGYLALVVIFLYALRYICSTNIQQLIVMLLATGLIVAVYGLVQVSGNDFIMWANPYNTTITTLGNPNFTSAFLSLTFILSFFLLLNIRVHIILKVFALPLALLSIFLIFKSESRQGFYSIAVGLLSYLTIYIYINNFRFKKLAVTSIILVSGISILGMLQIGPLANLLYKQSVSTRGYYWRAALKMFSEHPITGVGLDSYGEYFRRYKEIGYVRTYGVEITSNNAHNTFLQFFSTGGFIVGLLYLIFIGSILVYGIKSLKKTNNSRVRDINLMLISIFITYQSQSFISIDNLGLSVWSWTLAGAIIALSIEVGNDNLKITNQSGYIKNGNKKTNIHTLMPVFRFFLLTPIIVICIFLYRPESHMLILRGLVDPNNQGNNSLAYEYAYKIINNPLADPELKLKATLFLGDLGYLEDTGRNLGLLLQSNPNQFEYLWTMAYFQTQQGNYSEAVKLRLQVADIDPFNHSNYLELLKIYLEIGQKNKAVEIKELIMSIDPSSSSAKTAGTLIGV